VAAGQDSSKVSHPWMPGHCDVILNAWINAMKKKAKQPGNRGEGWIARLTFIKTFIATKNNSSLSYERQPPKWRDQKASTLNQRFKLNEAKWKPQIDALKSNQYR
jgi:hypothetical protein